MAPFSELAYTDGSIGIRIRIEGVEWVSTAILASILFALERAFSAVERDEALIMARELGVSAKDIDRLDDLIYQWSDNLRGHAIQIEEAAKGSLLVGGIIAAVSLWILEKAIGKTIEEAWVKAKCMLGLRPLLAGG